MFPRPMRYMLKSCTGASVRTWLAGQALSGAHGMTPTEVAKVAVEIADAVIAELAKPKGGDDDG